MISSGPKYLLSYVFFLVLLITMLVDENFFRYQEVLNLGVNWRVMDVEIVLVLLSFAIERLVSRGKKNIAPEYKRIIVLTSFVFAIALVAVVRGFIDTGSYAIGMARYSFSGIVLVYLLPSVIDSEWKFKTVLKLFFIVPLLAWPVHLLSQETALANIGPGERISDARTTLGFACSGMMAIGYWFFARRGRQVSILYLMIGVTIFFLLLIAGHRSVLVSSVLAMVVLFLIYIRHIRPFRLVAIMLGLALIVFLIVDIGLGDTLFQRFIFLTDYQQDPSGNWRVIGWLSYIELTKESNPLFGNGFVNLPEWRVDAGSVNSVWVHNEYVHLFFITGLVGIAALLALIVYVLSLGRKLATRPSDFLESWGGRALIVSYVFFLVASIFMVFYNQHILFWISLGILLASMDRLTLTRAMHRP